MSEVTGGKSLVVNSLKGMLSEIDKLLPRLQPGVVVSFDPLPPPPIPVYDNPDAAFTPTPPPAPQCLHRMIYIRSPQGGFWPIPESFLPDNSLSQLVRSLSFSFFVVFLLFLSFF
jgi:hypothetical protein